MSRSLVTGQHPVPSEGADKGGRKTRLTEDVIKGICNAIRMGAYAETSCALHGIYSDQLRRWVKLGIARPNSIYGAFCREVQKALAQAELRDLQVVDTAAQGSAKQYLRDDQGKMLLDPAGQPILIKDETRPQWQAAAWKLERRNPKRWGRNERPDESLIPTASSGDTSEDPKKISSDSEKRRARIQELQKKLSIIDGENES